jgi:hypothetical protein
MPHVVRPVEEQDYTPDDLPEEIVFTEESCTSRHSAEKDDKNGGPVKRPLSSGRRFAGPILP